MGAPPREILKRLCTLGGILSNGQPGTGFGKLFRANYRSKLNQKLVLKHLILWEPKATRPWKCPTVSEQIGQGTYRKLFRANRSKLSQKTSPEIVVKNQSLGSQRRPDLGNVRL